MHVVRTKTFKSGNSEAIRLPRELAYGADTELVMIRSGDVLTIYPAARTLSDMLTKLRTLPKPDYVETRDRDDIAEPKGL